MAGDLTVINSHNSENEVEFPPDSNKRHLSSHSALLQETAKPMSQQTDEINEQDNDYPNQHHINVDFKHSIVKKRSSQVITLDKYKGESAISSQERMTNLAQF